MKRALPRHTWAFDHGVDSPEQRVVLLSQAEFDARRFEPPCDGGIEGLHPIVADDLDAAGPQRERGGLAGPREAEHERPLHSLKRR